MGATTPDRPSPPQGPAVPIEGGHSDEGRDALAAQRAQLRELKQQCPGTHRANTRHTPEQGLVLPPDRTRPQRGVQVVIKGCQTLMQPGDLRRDIRLETA